MEAFTPQLAVERFHLHFARVLATGEHRSHYVIKGGCNLRFFFDSIRYSEDLDLDVAVGAPATLRHRVEKLLTSPALLLPLRAAGIVTDGISAPKQSDTTQRWKIGLRVEGVAAPLRTKIEFSRRTKPDDVAVEPVGQAIASLHGVPAPIVAHYVLGRAISQKIHALAGRTTVQARDIFDLRWLFARGAPPGVVRDVSSDVLRAAHQRAKELSRDEFEGQVVPFLRADRQVEYQGEGAWEAVQGEVLAQLERLQT